MVRIDNDRLNKISRLLAETEFSDRPFNFYSYRMSDGGEVIDQTRFPPLGHPAAVNFFFAVIAQDYGFWLGTENTLSLVHRPAGYFKPIFARCNGKLLKGSDFLCAASRRIFGLDPNFFHSRRLAVISEAAFKWWLCDDDGTFPFPDFSTRLDIARACGAAMARWYRWPENFRWINQVSNPLASFISSVSALPGYSGDSLNKKAFLLAMVLANRPEHFLRVLSDNPGWWPIVDYHLMRLLLRFGVIDPGDWTNYVTIRDSRPPRVPYIPQEGEKEIRSAVFAATDKIIKDSGKTMAGVDFLFWSARSYCPEMEEPKCARCVFSDVCAKKTRLFQPVIRTRSY